MTKDDKLGCTVHADKNWWYLRCFSRSFVVLHFFHHFVVVFPSRRHKKFRG